MCGISGYIGWRNPKDVISLSLSRLLHRGYDAAGIGLTVNGQLVIHKAVKNSQNDPIAPLMEQMKEFKLTGGSGLGHTRWLTNGKNDPLNAHPHTDCSGTLMIVHNGIVSNMDQLKKALIKRGHKIKSETDTEVIAHLIEEEISAGLELEDAVEKAMRHVKGTYGLAAISGKHPNKIVVASLGSEISIGIGNKEAFVSSEALGFCDWTNKEIPIKRDGEIVAVTSDGIIGPPRKIKINDLKPSDIDKGRFAHLYLKEVMEQPRTVSDALNRGDRLNEPSGDARLGGLEANRERLSVIERVFLVGCGTSFHAAELGEMMIGQVAGISNVASRQGHECRWYPGQIVPDRTAVIGISQSGGTRDTIDPVDEAKLKGALVLGVVNSVSSALDQLCGLGVHLNAGQEGSVASTKAFTSQIVVLGLITLFLGRQRNMSREEGQKIVKAFDQLPELVAETLRLDGQIQELAKECLGYTYFAFIGKHWHAPVAKEGALKLEEISYSMTKGMAAGELKHGPLAVLDENRPAILLIPGDSTFERMRDTLCQVRDRGIKTIAVTTHDVADRIMGVAWRTLIVPKSGVEMLQPVLSVIPLQLFAYYLALHLGRDIDRPRHLAKSVTVH